MSVHVEEDELLCDCVRERLNLTGTKVGCREGACGSCNVLVDDFVVRSCLILAPQVEGRAVRTIEGLAQGAASSPLEHAFVEHGAVQCGYCIPGMLVSASALAEETSEPTPTEIIDALAGNLCRCTGYAKIIAAVREATCKRPVMERDNTKTADADGLLQ